VQNLADLHGFADTGHPAFLRLTELSLNVRIRPLDKTLEFML
jgi:hypothetical protein